MIVRYLACALLCLSATSLKAAELYDAIGARLALMQEVAAYKWINGQPIDTSDIPMFLWFIADQRNSTDTFTLKLENHLLNRQSTIHRLATGHGNGIVV